MAGQLESYVDSFDEQPGYLDWAAFGPLSPEVRSEVHADAELLGTGRRSSVDLVNEHVDQSRVTAAAMLAVREDQVVIQPSASHGLQQAIYGLSGDLLLSRAEFPSLTVAVTRAEACGADVSAHWVEPDRGFMSPEVIRDALTEEVTAVAVSLVDFRTGYLTDLSAIRDVIGDRLLIVDAIQGLGVVDADYASADVVCANGYKWLRAGHGTGVASYSDRAMERITPVLSGYVGAEGGLPVDEVTAPVTDARAFLVSKADSLASARLGTALREIQDAGIDEVAAAVAARATRVIEIADEAGIAVLTPREEQYRAGIVTLVPEAQDAGPLSAELANAGVTTTARGGTIRVSAHAGTDDETLEMFQGALTAFAAMRSW
ncbi:hypothetical protein GCM10009808_13170 [Microbacterium sediminicola]|uniref:Aminotransferase class V domain-containing protein n=1 Tax=Microbacterium sediminicola TaxID=415210 RepID=A0ABN2I1N3_9MICO